MSNVGPESRSYERIKKNDLRRLLEIATRDRNDFFANHKQWKEAYEKRIVCVALCQGAAMHYVDGKKGINDFDIYTFYEANPKKAWYAKRIKSYDFMDPKFGKSKDRPNYVGRRVDCLGRAIEVRKFETAEHALYRYLKEGKTKSARLLAEAAVVLLEPKLGKILWPRRIKE